MNYLAEWYQGRKFGSNVHMCRAGVQIVATDDEGKRKYVFPCGKHTSPCLKLWEGAWHYKSGFNAEQAAQFVEAMEEAKELAKKWNVLGVHNKEDI